MGAVSEAAQVNARMDRAMKERGDAALASIGVTPSAAIRALWAKAAKRGESLDEVRRLVESTSDGGATADEAETRIAAFEQGRLSVLSSLEELGVQAADFEKLGDVSLKDELEDALWERLEERGLA